MLVGHEFVMAMLESRQMELGEGPEASLFDWQRSSRTQTLRLYFRQGSCASNEEVTLLPDFVRGATLRLSDTTNERKLSILDNNCLGRSPKH